MMQAELGRPGSIFHIYYNNAVALACRRVGSISKSLKIQYSNTRYHLMPRGRAKNDFFGFFEQGSNLNLRSIIQGSKAEKILEIDKFISN
jgi:hypothetical protein